MTVDANNLLLPSDNGIYRDVEGNISNCPEANGTLIVMNNGSGHSTAQMYVSSGGKFYVRTQWGAGSIAWTNWNEH